MVWTAFSRQTGKIVAYLIRRDCAVETAIELYEKAKQAVGRIAHIYTDANSCYDLAFKRYGVPEPHDMTKAETHLIEATNSSIRDNLARFNRKSKRFSKSFEMLDCTLLLFFYFKTFAH